MRIWIERLTQRHCSYRLFTDEPYYDAVVDQWFSVDGGIADLCNKDAEKFISEAGIEAPSAGELVELEIKPKFVALWGPY